MRIDNAVVEAVAGLLALDLDNQIERTIAVVKMV